jgi:hypothetical protein
VLLNEAGWDLYVDWADPQMPAKPDRVTAERIRERIRVTELFLFLATANSMASRWCPWEIGYADGVKPIDSIFVIPTAAAGTTHGSEYLDLYRRIDVSKSGRLANWGPSGVNGSYALR